MIKTTIKISAIFCLLLGFCSFAESYYSSDIYMHSPSEYYSDLDEMVNTLEEVHPNLYHSITKEEFNKEVSEIKRKINKPISDHEFTKLVNPLFSKVNDGHTWLGMSNYISDGCYKESMPVFPFEIDIVEDRFFVRKSFVDEIEIPNKSEILSINGKSPCVIINDFIDSYSGEHELYEKNVLSSSFSQNYANLYDFDDSYEIEYIEYNNVKIKKEIVRGVSFTEINGYNSIVESNYGTYNYKYIEDLSAGYIDIRAFSNMLEFRAFIDGVLDDMESKKAQNMIIDLRENSGGNMMLGTYFLCTLTDESFRIVGSDIQNISPKVLDSMEKNFKNWGYETSRTNNNEVLEIAGNGAEFSIALGRHESFDIEEKREYDVSKKFNGKIYVLVGPKTYSSAVMFASVIKDYNIASIIGQETGGMAGGYTNNTFFELSESKIGYSVSHEYFTRPNNDKTIGGVIPDYEVDNSVESYLSGEDLVFNKVKELILEKK